MFIEFFLERSEHPVPQDKETAIVAIQVDIVLCMVHTVVGRGHKGPLVPAEFGYMLRMYPVLVQQVELAGAWVPDTAVTEGLRGTWVVYALEDSGQPGLSRIGLRAVDVVHAENERLFVSGELGGLTLVASGLHKLVPGQLVQRIQQDVAVGGRTLKFHLSPIERVTPTKTL